MIVGVFVWDSSYFSCRQETESRNEARAAYTLQWSTSGSQALLPKSSTTTQTEPLAVDLTSKCMNPREIILDSNNDNNYYY